MTQFKMSKMFRNLITSKRDVEKIERSFGALSAQNDMGLQRGRSILEIMAVMAVMGLITFGGIEGYETVVGKIRANKKIEGLSELVKERQIQALDTSDNRPHKQTKTLEDVSVQIENGTKEGKESFFWIDIPLNDKVECEHLVYSDLLKSTLVTINNEVDGKCPGDVRMYFPKDPKDGDSALSTYENQLDGKTYLCPERAVCDGESVSCVDDDRHFNGRKCVKVCHTSACDEDGNPIECADSQYLNGTVCVDCLQGVAQCQDANTATSCRADYYLRNGQCLECPENATCSGDTADFVCDENFKQNTDKNACVARCTSNAQCTAENTYCNVDESEGVCLPINGSAKGDYLASDEDMTYQSAQNWCAAQEGQNRTHWEVIDVEDFDYSPSLSFSDVLDKILGISPAYAACSPTGSSTDDFFFDLKDLTFWVNSGKVISMEHCTAERVSATKAKAVCEQTTCPNGQVYKKGKGCVTPCTSNTQCTTANTYCNVDESEGVCLPINSSAKGDYLVSNEDMSYQSAQNWCAAQAHPYMARWEMIDLEQCEWLAFNSFEILNKLFGISTAYAAPSPHDNDLCPDGIGFLQGLTFWTEAGRVVSAIEEGTYALTFTTVSAAKAVCEGAGARLGGSPSR